MPEGITLCPRLDGIRQESICIKRSWQHPLLSAETVRDTQAVYSHCVLPLDAVKNMATLTGSALIVDEEILAGKRIHHLAEDRPNDEHYLDNTSGTVISENLHIGFRKYKYFKYGDESMKPKLYLRYCKLKDQSVNKYIMAYFAIKWLLYQREIPRECHNY